MLRDLFPDLCQSENIAVAGLTADSREVGPGYVFAAIAGGSADGRSYIDTAVARGACAILTDQRPGTWSVPALKSPEPRRELARAAARLIPEQPPVIVAVTGTNGKSSTVDFLRQIWTICGHRSASIGTLGVIADDAFNATYSQGHTTPDPIALHRLLSDLAGQDIGHVAVEASSHGLDQYRLDGMLLSAGAFSNLSRDHLDYHADMDAYRAAKMRLFSEVLPRNAPAILSADDPHSDAFARIAEAAGQNVFSLGWRGRDLKLCELTPGKASQDMLLRYRGRETTIRLPLIGAFQALNALMAAGIALALGEESAIVFAALAKLQGVKGRLELVGSSASGGRVFVDFAHTPGGLETLLRAVRPHTPGLIVCVFGCGGERDRSKRPLMGRIAGKWADRVIVTDDNPRSEDPAQIRAAIRREIPGAQDIADRAEAIKAAILSLHGGDSLIIAGKGHETDQCYAGGVIPFSDQDFSRTVLTAEGGHV